MNDIELNRLMRELEAKYPLETTPLRISDKVFKLLQIKDLEDLLAEWIEERDAQARDLPYWAKVWDSSLLLAYFAGRQPVVFGRRILEIGTGIGTVGIYAALCGHQVTLSDTHDDALKFARANALINGVPQVQVRRIDWSEGSSSGTFDVIIGSEVMWDQEHHDSLIEFLDRTLEPGGMIFLAKNSEPDAPSFFAKLTRRFEYKRTIQPVGSGSDIQYVELYAVRRKAPS